MLFRSAKSTSTPAVTNTTGTTATYTLTVSNLSGGYTFPEEAIGIARDIGARAAVGMHWGSIMLTPEDPFEAPGRFRRAALEQQFGEANAWVMQVGGVRGF